MVVVVCSCNQGWDPSSAVATAVPFKLRISSGFWAFSEVECPCSNGSVTENFFSSFLQGDLQFPLKHGHSRHCMKNHSGSIQCHDTLLIHEHYWKRDVRKDGKEKLSATYVLMKRAKEEGGNRRICSSQNLVLANCLHKVQMKCWWLQQTLI